MTFDSVSEYNLKYEKLISLNFCKSIDNLELSIYYFDKSANAQDMISEQIRITTKKGEHVEFAVRGPEGEEIDAFVLTFRFFIQNNEPSSIANLAKVYSEQDVTSNLKQEFESVRNDLNKYLDEGVMYCRIKNSRENERIKLSRRNVMEAVIYGLYAHSNSEHRTIYENYLKNDKLFLFLQSMKKVLHYLKEIYELNYRLMNNSLPDTSLD